MLPLAACVRDPRGIVMGRVAVVAVMGATWCGRDVLSPHSAAITWRIAPAKLPGLRRRQARAIAGKRRFYPGDAVRARSRSLVERGSAPNR